MHIQFQPGDYIVKQWEKKRAERPLALATERASHDMECDCCGWPLYRGDTLLYARDADRGMAYCCGSCALRVENASMETGERPYTHITGARVTRAYREEG